MRYIFVSILPFLLVTINHTIAQNTSDGNSPKNPTVEVDFKSGFKTAVPFDVSFNIKGEIGSTVKRVDLKYGATNKQRVTNYFKNKSYTTDPDGFNYEDAKSTEPKSSTFAFSEIGPLRPHTTYIFKFITYSKPNISEAEIILLKQRIASRLKGRFANPEAITSTLLDNLYDDLNTTASQTISQFNFVDKSGNPFKLSTFGGPLNAVSNRVIALSSDLSLSIPTITDIITDTSPGSLNASLFSILPKLHSLNNNDITLSDFSKRIWLSTVDPTLSGTLSNTLSTGSAQLEQLINDFNEFKEVLIGRKKIVALSIISTPSFDDNSIKYLRQVLEIINSITFKDDTGTKVFNRDETLVIDKVIVLLNSLLDNQIETFNAKSELSTIEKQIPDLFAEAFVAESFLVSDPVEVDVTTKNTPYIALDAGIFMSFNSLKYMNERIGNDNYLFTYQGANIYLVPVTKKTPIRTFKFRHAIMKAFSFQVGIATLLGSFNSDRLENSLGNVGNLVLGAGFRFNRVTKLSFSTVFVNTKNINQTITNSRLNPMYNISFSLDIGVIQAFGNIATLLKLN